MFLCSVFKVRGGLKWTRTTDLTLIRRALYHLSYEPMLCLFGGFFTCSPFPFRKSGGDERDRTDDPLLAKQVLSQLSYTPIFGFAPQKLNNDVSFPD